MSHEDVIAIAGFLSAVAHQTNVQMGQTQNNRESVLAGTNEGSPVKIHMFVFRMVQYWYLSWGH